ncbi:MULTISPECIES: SDR family oxidoreductase [Leptospira]|uniref:KR domain protein n=3 Tax=Leptospira kirschneri TaxID=29507 RepID=A0A0E2BBY0_9LEPT|nr:MULTISPECIES: SDR family oxidoreductase [Leptospira]EMO76141.1 KR domain protein [Leptospira kirschneri str. 200801925]EKO14668.1 KR domain protein [Leptospira kirschneri str. H1]EKO52779.1 KR domain protein [Leptospira kirschneri str. 200802841]EKO58706.1 KR domain protein [Leptospira kirschneri str. H2]EKP07323.1 KR domain protein [Leptospira kirschneri str. 2008720114]
MDIKGKTILVTGSASGLGKAMAEYFAKKGAKIVLSDISEEKLKEAEKDIKTLGAEVFSFKADVSKEEDAEKLMQSAVKQFGSLDVAILNAGILRDGLLVKTDKETGKVISKMSLSNWQSVIDVNLTGVFLTGREAAIQMIESKSKGVIIPIASVAMHGNPGQTNYSAAKAGVASMTKLWAKELSRYGIRVAGIAPGFIKTEMVMKDMNPEALKKWEALIPIGRLGEPYEIALSADFIVSNDLVSGVILEISGGVKI